MPRIIATVAFIAFGVSFLLRAGFTADASFFNFVLPLLVQGIAMATFFLAMITILLDGVPPQRIPSASGVSNFARITAGGFAASVVTTLWDRREALHQSRLADQTTIFSPLMRGAVANLHRFGLPDLGRPGRHRPHHDGAGLSAGGGRYLLGLGLDLHRPDRHGLALPQGQIGRRCARRGGLMSAETSCCPHLSPRGQARSDVCSCQRFAAGKKAGVASTVGLTATALRDRSRAWAGTY